MLATIIMATNPIFTVLIAVLRLRQPVRPHHLAGLGLALCGIGLASAITQSSSGALALVLGGIALYGMSRARPV